MSSRLEIRTFLAALLVSATLMVAWAFATPPAASPDEPAHAVKAASVARGQFLGEPTPIGHVVQVPRAVASLHAETCTAFNTGSAACAVPLRGDPNELVDAPTTAGTYNPLYYALVGWPSLVVPGAAGVYAMRVMSALLVAFFIGLAAATMKSWTSCRFAMAGLAVAATPMLLFLGGSINPNALEATASLAAFTAMIAVIRYPDDARLSARCAVLILGAAFAANTRGLSALWVAVAILAPMVLVPPARIGELLRRVPVRAATVAVAVAVILAVLWLATANSLTPYEAVEDFYPADGASPLYGFIYVLRETVPFAEQMVGAFGWLDTPADPIVPFVWSMFVGALSVIAASVLRARAALFSALLLLGFVLLPAIVQAAFVSTGGIIWQGRYALALFAMFAVGTSAMIGDALPRSARTFAHRGIIALMAGWAAAQVIAFAPTLKRYAVGDANGWSEFLLAPEWSAPGGNLVWMAIATGAAVVGAALVAGRGHPVSRGGRIIQESTPRIRSLDQSAG